MFQDFKISIFQDFKSLHAKRLLQGFKISRFFKNSRIQEFERSPRFNVSPSEVLSVEESEAELVSKADVLVAFKLSSGG